MWLEQEQQGGAGCCLSLPPCPFSTSAREMKQEEFRFIWGTSSVQLVHCDSSTDSVPQVSSYVSNPLK